MGYVSIRIEEEAAGVLNRKCAELGLTKSQVVVRGCAALGNTDDLLDQLDKQAEEEAAAANALFASLDDDELPECCQGIYTGRKEDRCEHWIIKNNRWYNQGTKRYIDDPAYVNYFQNA